MNAASELLLYNGHEHVVCSGERVDLQTSISRATSVQAACYAPLWWTSKILRLLSETRSRSWLTATLSLRPTVPDLPTQSASVDQGCNFLNNSQLPRTFREVDEAVSNESSPRDVQVWMSPGSTLIEIFPFNFWYPQYFGALAQEVGVTYIPLMDPESRTPCWSGFRRISTVPLRATQAVRWMHCWLKVV